MSELNPPSEFPEKSMEAAADIEKNRVFGILAYLGPLVLVPILAARESRFARYHANQGLILILAWLIVMFTLSFLMMMIGMLPVIRILAPLLACLAGPVLGLGGMVLSVLGIINAAQGLYKPLPILGNWKILRV